MNSTSDWTDQGSNPNLEGQPLGHFGYGIGLSLGIFIVFVIIAHASYTYKRILGGDTNHHSFASTGTTTYHRDFSINITIQHMNGLDEATLSSYPQFTYSQFKGDSTTTTTTTSACSICLAEYDHSDLLRLLPHCGHLFHLNCVDPWLMLHPTCPVCRYSLLPTPLAPAPLPHPTY